jgi:SAM-dependent methyltransferase
MYKQRSQIDLYDEVYKKDVYTELEVPDYKITGGIDIKNKKILVVGAGTARDVKFLVKNNNIIAADFSISAVKHLKKIGIEAFQADLNNPIKRVKNNSIDIVVAKDILEHLEKPSVLLSEIRRVLKPNGYAVLDVPNHFFLPMRLRLLFGNNLIWKTIDHDHTKDFKEWDYMHKIFFTWNGFKEFIKLHNLKIARNFWDFGTLNHYSQPEMAIIHLENSGKKGMANILKTFWSIVNFVLPRSFRSYLVSLSPSLFCASFYVWVKPNK